MTIIWIRNDVIYLGFFLPQMRNHGTMDSVGGLCIDTTAISRETNQKGVIYLNHMVNNICIF